MVKLFPDYLDGEAIKLYLTDVFEALEEWSDVQTTMIQRFRIVPGDPLRELIHCRQKLGQPEEECFDAKR